MSRVENLHKHPNSSTNVWSIYKRVGEFFDGVDLDGENWHSGMTRLRNNGNLKHRSSYREDAIRDDELADAVYLRSGDKEKAFGVITNRRANYWTLGEEDCLIQKNLPAPEHSDFEENISEEDVLPDEAWFTHLLRNYGPVSHNMNDFGNLRVRNMSGSFLGLPKEYKIKYYSPYDQINSIKEETRWSPIIPIEHPDFDTLDIVLFEIFPMGENFKSMSNDSTDTEDIPSKKPKKDKKDGVKIYPNPNDGNFVIFVENPSNATEISITDNLGKQIDYRYSVREKNIYNVPDLRSGIYYAKIVFTNQIVRKKFIIN